MSSHRKSFKTGIPDLPSHDRWLLSYADLVTLLLAVFIVLFASQRNNHGSIRNVSTAIRSGFEILGVGFTQPLTPHDVNKKYILGQSREPAFSRNAAELSRQLQSVLGDAINKHEVVVQQTADGFTIRLQELGFFESGNAALLPDAVQTLQRTGRLLEQNNLEVRVEGHSDDQPIRTAAFHSNWELSTARAMSVLAVFVDQARFPPDRIAVLGYGSYRPIADNSTEDGRRKNRRVDLVVLTPHDQQTSNR